MRTRIKAAVAVVPLAIAGTTIASATAATATPSTKVLGSAVLPGLPTATDLGAVSPTQVLRIGVHLAHPDEAGEEAYAKAVYDPSSAAFHHYLTPSTYARRFGVAPATYQATLSHLTAKGLSAAYQSAPGDYVLLTGTAKQVDATFGTAEHTFKLSDGTVVRASKVAPTVDSVVDAVIGLDSREVMHLDHQDTCLEGICTGALTPQDLWSAYDQPAGNGGDGQKLAIIGEGHAIDSSTPSTPSDNVVNNLRLFEAAHGLPRVNVRTTLAADDQTATDGTEEWDIDTQASTGMAPNLSELHLYFGNSLASADIVPALAAWANDPTGPLQGSFSVGGCEVLNYALGSITAESPVLRQLAMEGRSLFVSTGDTGGTCAIGSGAYNGVGNTVVPQVEWPASSPYVVAVGGTVLYTADADPAKRSLEYAWTHGGGGTSLIEPAPAWQQQLVQWTKQKTVIVGHCALKPDGSPAVGAPLCRGLPDVASLSGDVLTNGYTITDASTTQGGGTSLSSPLWAGMWARINAAAPTADGLGLATASLYGAALDPAKDVRDFYDVSVGSNVQWTAQPRSAINATGWDYTTGLGTPDVSNLAQDIAGTTAPRVPGLPAAQPDVMQPPTVVCPAPGSITDPTGDANGIDGFAVSEFATTPVSNPGADLTGAQVSYDPSAQALTWTTSLAQLNYPRYSVFEGTEVEDRFTIGATTYEVRVARDPQGHITAELGTWDPVNFLETDLAPIEAIFDAGANRITASVPAALFHTATGATLTSGTALDDLNVVSDLYVDEDQNTETGALSTDTAAGSCGYVLP